MPHIEWTTDLEIGIGVIDRQHQRIVDYINTLTDVGNEPNRDVISVHQKTHEAFRNRISYYKTRFDEGEDVAQSLSDLLRTWLLRHIVSDDCSYAPLVKSKLPGIERKEQGSWLGNAVKRFFSS